MKFIKVKSYEELSAKAAEIIANQVKSKPDSVLGLATGSSPVGTYKVLVDMYKKGELDFSRTKSVNLDEYVGLTGDNDQSYRYFMNDNLFNHINISETHVPNGVADDMDEECASYDKLIKDLGGIDLQLLGIGLDGHIGFNEPEEFFPKGTHIVELEESTIEANARFFASADDVHKKAITMGILPIMQAKKVLLIANGQSKKDIVEKAFFGPITPMVPASVLQLHNDITVIFSES